MNNPYFSLVKPKEPGSSAISTSVGILSNGLVIFTISGGPIEIITLMARCVTVNDATLSTLQYRADPIVGNTATISGTTGSLASKGPGSLIILNPVTSSAAPVLTTGAPNFVGQSKNGFIIAEGVIELVIGVGPTTGTWKHFLHYRPLSENAIVVGV